MIVYGTSLSPFVRKVRVAIAEKGVPATYKPVFPHDTSDAFKACSPFGKIPSLDDEGVIIPDSSAICRYLEAKYPTPALFPSSAVGAARAVWFDKFADTELAPAVLKVFLNIVVKKMQKLEPDMAVVNSTLENDLPKLYAYLETQIQGPYLIDDAFSIADIVVASPFVNLKMAGHPPDAAKWPALSGYVNAILERPSFVNAKD